MCLWRNALLCKKGGFVSKRHDNIRDLLTVLLNKVCVDVQSEPHLIPIETETFNLRSANNNNDGSRLAVEARGFWTRDQTSFFDIRVTHVGSQSNKNRDTNTVEQGGFTPLVFGTNGGMGDECRKFVDEKKNEEYSQFVTWLRIRLSMEVVRSTILCVRGSGTPFRRNFENFTEDFMLLDNFECGVE